MNQNKNIYIEMNKHQNEFQVNLFHIYLPTHSHDQDSIFFLLDWLSYQD